MTDIEPRPPVPASCQHRPQPGGLVAPWVNVELADGGVDFRARHQARYEDSWRRGLCQVCGSALSYPVVLFGTAQSLASRHFDEAPVCGPCAMYTSRACPMVAGRMDRHPDRPRVSEGRRGRTCSVPGCGCGGWQPIADGGLDGLPAEAWYAVYVAVGSWQVTASIDQVRCSDKGCLHDRVVVNGGLLAGRPLKVVLVSGPGQGRVWRTLSPAEAAE